MTSFRTLSRAPMRESGSVNRDHRAEDVPQNNREQEIRE